MAPVLTQKNVQDHAPPDFQPVGDGRMMKGEEWQEIISIWR